MTLGFLTPQLPDMGIQMRLSFSRLEKVIAFYLQWHQLHQYIFWNQWHTCCDDNPFCVPCLHFPPRWSACKAQRTACDGGWSRRGISHKRPSLPPSLPPPSPWRKKPFWRRMLTEMTCWTPPGGRFMSRGLMVLCFEDVLTSMGLAGCFGWCLGSVSRLSEGPTAGWFSGRMGRVPKSVQFLLSEKGARPRY